MYSCPSCGRSDIEKTDTCSCGADLTLLRHLDAVCDAWFNRALGCLAEGEEGRALEWLSACCAGRPSDAGAALALAKVWARLGHWREASSALSRAADIDPCIEGLEAVRQAIQEGLSPAAKPPKERAGAGSARGRAGEGRKKIPKKASKRRRKRGR